MKAVVVSPYFNTLGGGERYALTFAQALLDKSWSVDVTIGDKSIISKAKKRFNLPLNDVNLVSLSNFVKNRSFQKKYDLIFWVSDGSVPLLMGRKNLLHFQIPFHNVGGKSIINRLKQKRIDKVVCNSLFTKKVIDQEYGINSDVWYPPVGVEEFSPASEKENYILAVGRFEKSQTEKRQDVLIETFKKMTDKGLSGWKLILAGGSTGGEKNNELLNELKKTAAGFPISFKVNVPFLELKALYSKAKIFWHAAGFGIDEEKFPEKTEHFGMSTVEAMAAGCIPIVQGKGGQKEIVEEKKNGFLWLSADELIANTLKVIPNNELSVRISTNAVQRSKYFSKEIFFKKVYSFINE